MGQLRATFVQGLPAPTSRQPQVRKGCCGRSRGEHVHVAPRVRVGSELADERSEGSKTTSLLDSKTQECVWWPKGVEDYMITTPVFRAVGLGRTKDSVDWAECKRVAKVLFDELKDIDNEAYMEKIHGYYVPMYMWIKDQMLQRKVDNSEPALVGWSAPQGAMKTIVSAAMEKVFAGEGFHLVTIGADDFYLTREEQAALSKKYESNALLQSRGNPGTMDVDLMIETIKRLREVKEDNEVKIPRYNKSAFSGEGDRCPEEEWTVIKDKVDIIILEGWCLGFQPVEHTTGDLIQVNEFLKNYARVYDYLDAILVCQVDNLPWIYSWRQQAEDRMRKRGKEGMSSEMIRKFVDRFMPAYHQYLPTLYSKNILPGRPQLKFKLDINRIPID
eukprot:Plantae.Rhodophyta-Purpureofilum_apyrenoidigerum.ctg5768.p1 GENE.Plantae.Rhodophyta-Purpureofilum_apyrenoidigerum.ctg5768~~Plantae.Rhodophyta-Purpureofilum_apyrenoidigerum.ctg5768.p1  ORF type:complete len:388 (-),score=55.71 Plantae.Rhodophyta-Purpureofilum_apyrenoidigerum.ctg5768:1087-2250(-)